jgi:hypothetical protein
MFLMGIKLIEISYLKIKSLLSFWDMKIGLVCKAGVSVMLMLIQSICIKLRELVLAVEFTPQTEFFIS